MQRVVLSKQLWKCIRFNKVVGFRCFSDEVTSFTHLKAEQSWQGTNKLKEFSQVNSKRTPLQKQQNNKDQDKIGHLIQKVLDTEEDQLRLEEKVIEILERQHCSFLETTFIMKLFTNRIFSDDFYSVYLKKLEIASKLAIEQSGRFKYKNISNFIYTLSLFHPSIQRKYREEILKILKETRQALTSSTSNESLKAIDLSMLGIALVKLGYSDEHFHNFLISNTTTDILEEAAKQPKKYPSQLFGVCWYFSKHLDFFLIPKRLIGQGQEVMIKNLSYHTLKCLPGFRTEDFCKFVPILGKLGAINSLKDHNFLMKILYEKLRNNNLKELKLEDWNSIFFGIEGSKFYQHDPIVVKDMEKLSNNYQLEQRFKELLKNTDSRSLKNNYASFLSNLANLKFLPVAFFHKQFKFLLSDQGEELLKTMNSSSILTLYKVVAKLNLADNGEAFQIKEKLLQSHLLPKLSSLSNSNILHLTWNLIAEGNIDPKIWSQDIIDPFCRLVGSAFEKDQPLEPMWMLWQSLIALKLEENGIFKEWIFPKLGDGLRETILEEATKIGEQLGEDYKHQKREQKGAFQRFEDTIRDKIFEDFGKEHQILYEVPTGLYWIDIYFPKQNLCVEIDGSTHTYGEQGQWLAKTKLKYNLFEKAGLRFIIVSSQQFIDEYKRLQEEELKNYIQGELEREVRAEDFKSPQNAFIDIWKQPL